MREECLAVKSFSFSIESTLRASAAEVWAHAGSMAGVNRELWPLAQMTYPRRQARLMPDTVPLGRPAFRSWILLFGLLPIDYSDVTLLGLEPGVAFNEVSTLGSMRLWRHRRTLLPTAQGCIVRDETFGEPRFPWMTPLLSAAYRLTFEQRHRYLRRIFGAA
jgi:hypothetical protein